MIALLGGDDHVKFANRFLNQQLVAIINSDTSHSVGAAAKFDSPSFIDFLGQAENGAFEIEEWTRIQLTINKRRYHSALSEVALMEREAKFGSRIEVRKEHFNTLCKGSGVLIATGYGSTGWFRSASRYVQSAPPPWPRTAMEAHWVEREPYGELSYSHTCLGRISTDDTYVFTSNSNHEGIISIDSVRDIPFPRGSRVAISIAPNPLNVLCAKGGDPE